MADEDLNYVFPPPHQDPPRIGNFYKMDACPELRHWAAGYAIKKSKGSNVVRSSKVGVYVAESQDTSPPGVMGSIVFMSSAYYRTLLEMNPELKSAQTFWEMTNGNGS